MSAFKYSPLSPGEDSFRLLTVCKGHMWQPITCQLFDSSMDHKNLPTYKALSYTWFDLKDDTEYTPPVTVDGQAVNMQENLCSALWHIRQREQDVTLWVDAICINQSDKKEKGHQVKQMGKIYENAEEVLIWLGSSDDDIASLMEFINWIDSQVTALQAGGSTADWKDLCHSFAGILSIRSELGDHSKQRKALRMILKRRWFSRVWILQEVAKAKMARIMCGSGSCAARTFALMPEILELPVNEHTRAVLDIMPRFRKNTWWSSGQDLHFLLNKFSACQASVTRDKVYALLGMSQDACDPKQFYPSYEKGSDEVFRDTASFVLFGEILDSSYSFPTITVFELGIPIIQLAEKMLDWSIGQSRDATKRTATLLVRRLGEGFLKKAPLLSSLAEKRGHLDKLQNLQPLENAYVSIEFGDDCNKLNITSNQEHVSLAFEPKSWSPLERRPSKQDFWDISSEETYDRNVSFPRVGGYYHPDLPSSIFRMDEPFGHQDPDLSPHQMDEDYGHQYLDFSLPQIVEYDGHKNRYPDGHQDPYPDISLPPIDDYYGHQGLDLSLD